MGERFTYVLLAVVSVLAVACGSGEGEDNVAPETQGAGAMADARPARLPGAPEIVRVTSGDGYATIDWTAPADILETASGGGESISGETVVSRYVVTGFPDGSRSLPGDVLTARVGGLTNGQEYTFTVRAANEAGFGPDSAPSLPVLVAAPPGPPPAVAATGLTEGGVRVAWRAPSRDGGSEIITYVLNSETGGATLVLEGEPAAGYSLIGEPELTTRPGIAGGGSMVFVLDLAEAASEDRYRVAAANERGLGQWSDWTIGSTGATAAPGSVLDANGNPEDGSGESSPTEFALAQQIEPDLSTDPGVATPEPVVAGTPQPATQPDPGTPGGTPIPDPGPPIASPAPPGGPGAEITVKWLPTLYGEEGPPPGWQPSLPGSTGEPFLLHSIEAWSTDPVDVFRSDISWGDGTTDQGWFRDPVYVSSRTADGTAQLFAYHTYSEPGRYPVTVTVSAINHSGVVGQTTIEALID